MEKLVLLVVVLTSTKWKKKSLCPIIVLTEVINILFSKNDCTMKLETTIVNNHSAYIAIHTCVNSIISLVYYFFPCLIDFFTGQKTMGTSVFWAFRTFQFNLYLSWPILGRVRNQKWKNSCVWILSWIQMFTFNCHFGPS